jgi:sugar lactone lactonase YvrE
MEHYRSRRLGTPLLTLLSLVLLLVSSGLAQSAPEYRITTVAGSGPSNVAQGGYGGDGGPAINAALNQPTGVAFSPTGDLYFCDFGNGAIRKVDARTGLITTIAGTGVRGFGGDGGPAASAVLGGPGSIATDSAGNIYFADPYNYRVRRISAATGIITTVAGDGLMVDPPKSGPPDIQSVLAVNVAIGSPTGIALDNKGGLYISNGPDRVWKVYLNIGIITTFAGAGGSRHSGDDGPAVLAQLDQPEGLAVDAAGNLYIAARGEHRIRKVDAKTGIITTIAGASSGNNTGNLGIVVYQGGFSGDGGPAINALLNDPEDLSVDAAGNVYISDTQNHRIRRIDAATGIIHTIAGTGVKGFSGDGGLATDAEISFPAGLAVDSAGRIYFADEANQRIRMLAPIQPLPPSTKFRGTRDIGPVDIRK